MKLQGILWSTLENDLYSLSPNAILFETWQISIGFTNEF